MDARNETLRLLQGLRLLIQRSEHSQTKIEERARFSRGYLSQLLNGHVEIKLWHLLVTLEALGVSPADLFFQLFPRHRSRVPEVLEGFRSSSGKMDKSLMMELARLYGYGIESVEDLTQRLGRCEEVLDELEALG